MMDDYLGIGLIILALPILFLSSRFPSIFAFTLNTFLLSTISYSSLHHFFPLGDDTVRVVWPGTLLAGALTALVSLFWPVGLFALCFSLACTLAATYVFLPLLGQPIALIALFPVAFGSIVIAYWQHRHLLLWSTSALGSSMIVFGVNLLHPLSTHTSIALAAAWFLSGVLVQYYFLPTPKDNSSSISSSYDVLPKNESNDVTYQRLNKILAA